MTTISEEIHQLQVRILELEKQKKEKDESDKKTSIEHNFNVISELLDKKKTAITNNRYSKAVPLARYYDQELVTHLEAIYNILQIVDERLKKLEQNGV
jgi:glycine/serine hydroxymethyltransferase